MRERSSAATDDAPADAALVDALDALTAVLGLPRAIDELRVDGEPLGDQQIEAVVDDIVSSMPGLGPRADVAAAVGRIRHRR